uniref:Uncharacterized protein n=1 Tax=Arundo donax TaxID=35708 RepID=A0A0A8ZMW8_ARUDO
MQWPTTEIPTS